MSAKRSRRLISALAIGALTPVAARTAAAQMVVLQVKPHVGDTLRMRLDQESAMTGVRRTSTGESSAMVINTMKMFSRAIVEGSAENGTTLLAVTDSLILSTTDENSRASTARAAQQMRGQRLRFRVSPDGTVSMADSNGGVSWEVAQAVSLMPPAFPKGPIKVGESWIREMALPVGSQLGAQLSGKLHVTFRLDSLTHGREWAFVSMRGEVQPATGPGAAFGATLEKGLVNGTMLVDQRRGWLTESWFNILVSSTMNSPAVSGILSMHMQMRITQHMHTMDRR
ncbi:MAG TPA: hypothetical protein VKP00_09905 [Gemmatimonadaceae bacterium]|nr:hypothetical protein [Gemmatimonadaceae bacterium]